MPAPIAAKVPIAVIGAGITGLCAAWHLHQSGHTVRVFESTGRVGGNIRTESINGWLLEAGPNSLQNTPAASSIISQLALNDQLLTANPEAKNRYILRNGAPMAAPASPPGFIKSKLFSTRAKFQLFSELLYPPRKRKSDIDLASFVTSHFGRDLVAYGLDPFVSGIYAGDATRLSARLSFPALWESERKHGSLIRGMIASAKAKRKRGEPRGPAPIVTFRDGLEVLPKTLAAALPHGSLELKARVHTVTPATKDQPWRLTWSRDETPSVTERFAAVVIALPSEALSQLAIGEPADRPLASLGAIHYPPVSSLFLGYKREQVSHPLDGFGILFPSAEKRPLLGVLFNSTLFPGRAPAGHIALTVMTGGVRSPDCATLSDAELLKMVCHELADILGVSGEPVFIRRNVWPRAIPQYELGYQSHLDLIARMEAAHPGLHIGGSVRDGISLPNCLASGEKLAQAAISAV